uniref:Uncharacterized protein n=1 Tax=Anguilla anguilla TaxID=7936 RepID=A0A0E9SBZ1_ANGAN
MVVIQWQFGNAEINYYYYYYYYFAVVCLKNAIQREKERIGTQVGHGGLRIWRLWTLDGVENHLHVVSFLRDLRHFEYCLILK